MSNNFHNEVFLKEQLSKENERALSFLIDTYHHKLCAYAYNLTKDQNLSKDIVQNVFIKLWEKRKTINYIKSLNSFLFKCTYNEFVNQYRKDNRYLQIKKEHGKHLEKFLSKNDESLIEEKLKAIDNEINKLPPKCRETFLLSKKSGLTNAEIAAYMQVSIKTVERQITKAFKAIRNNLNPN